ncbi:hypothetical protein EGI22_03080 [Lacihabitans sp. LS3-19]|uniref:hypothetical protein n=1 Tax=Lacihabitans sp. LS3-19 TaxID=2487335 RepID=UPI0020CBA6DB|nr:hypothetical protein [Lacihabitans sp. LS3-19]MCP9766876.1 hypothetical protein [Lacihabitans sp. LS3-19]
MKTKLLFLFLLSFFLFSCEKDETTDYRALAAGEWEGTFKGDDMGTWTMNIKSDGSLTGGLLSTNVPGITFPGKGTVSVDGDILADIQVTSTTSSMTGKIDGNNMSGTWSNAIYGIGGTWSGSKK